MIFIKIIQKNDFSSASFLQSTRKPFRKCKITDAWSVWLSYPEFNYPYQRCSKVGVNFIYLIESHHHEKSVLGNFLALCSIFASETGMHRRYRLNVDTFFVKKMKFIYKKQFCVKFLKRIKPLAWYLFCTESLPFYSFKHIVKSEHMISKSVLSIFALNYVQSTVGNLRTPNSQ